MAFLEEVPLELGSKGKLLIREEEVHLSPGGNKPYRILYASDLHLSGKRAPRLVEQMMEAVDKARPNLILFGGDLVDDLQALPNLTQCVRELSSFAPLAGVPGNHDQQVGLTRVQKALERGGGFWLGKDSFSFDLMGRKVRVDGRLKPGASTGEFKILCTHYPDFLPRAARLGYSLVLAGHLHGCQFVFWKGGEKLYPGAWFYRWNGLKFKDGPCRLLVSRGVSDSLPIRFNCPREVLLCKVY
jgi:predicted MPP superfamily phosphohydrolase